MELFAVTSISLLFKCLGDIIYEGNSTVDEGEPFVISCFLTLFDPVQWEKDGKAVMYEPGVTSDYSFHEETVEGKVMASIIVKAALPHHSGSYRCNTLSKESHQIYVTSGKVLHLGVGSSADVSLN